MNNSRHGRESVPSALNPCIPSRQVIFPEDSRHTHRSAPPLFVLMPFGKKSTVGGTVVDFDAVYRELIVPAIEKAGLDPLRADDELTGGIIHKPMFERLILCEYAMADQRFPGIWLDLVLEPAPRGDVQEFSMFGFAGLSGRLAWMNVSGLLNIPPSNTSGTLSPAWASARACISTAPSAGSIWPDGSASP